MSSRVHDDDASPPRRALELSRTRTGFMRTSKVKSLFPKVRTRYNSAAARVINQHPCATPTASEVYINTVICYILRQCVTSICVYIYVYIIYIYLYIIYSFIYMFMSFRIFIMSAHARRFVGIQVLQRSKCNSLSLIVVTGLIINCSYDISPLTEVYVQIFPFPLN